jgi:DNA-binding response OmpR family regulator
MSKVLVVDDDEALRRLMHLELGDSYEVIDSGEPELGLALALEHQPDAIVLVSGEGGGQTKEHCEQLGAAGYFEKPINFDRLRERLKQVTNNRQHISRSEVRVKLSVALRLKGSDSKGEKFNEVATTEDISLSGFLCRCNAQLPANSILDVYLSVNADEYVGKARIIHSGPNDTNIWRYGCRFIEKVGPWVLQ